MSKYKSCANTKTIKATDQGKKSENLAGKYDEANDGEGPKNIDNLAVGTQAWEDFLQSVKSRPDIKSCTFAEADEDNHPDDDEVERNLELEIAKSRLKFGRLQNARLTCEAFSGEDEVRRRTWGYSGELLCKTVAAK